MRTLEPSPPAPLAARHAGRSAVAGLAGCPAPTHRRPTASGCTPCRRHSPCRRAGRPAAAQQWPGSGRRWRRPASRCLARHRRRRPGRGHHGGGGAGLRPRRRADDPARPPRGRAGLVDGLAPVDPGLARGSRWRPDPATGTRRRGVGLRRRRRHGSGAAGRAAAPWRPPGRRGPCWCASPAIPPAGDAPAQRRQSRRPAHPDRAGASHPGSATRCGWDVVTVRAGRPRPPQSSQ